MKHLTVEHRYKIWAMMQQGSKQKDIALAIGKDKSVVSRELRRNFDNRSLKYNPDLAQCKYDTKLRSNM